MDVRSLSSICSCLALTDVRWSSLATWLKSFRFVWLRFQKYSGVVWCSHLVLYSPLWSAWESIQHSDPFQESRARPHDDGRGVIRGRQHGPSLT